MTKQLIDTLAGAPCETHAQSEGHEITIGDGFTARSYRHSDFRGLMDPLIMVDHFVATKPTFGPHAHAGLSAVTVMFEDSVGAFRNRDSLGNDLDLAPGDLYWFKAARGALHDEAPRPDARMAKRGLLWLFASGIAQVNSLKFVCNRSYAQPRRAE